MNSFPTRDQVERIKKQYPAGTRIRLHSMDDPYAPIPPGTEGVVQAGLIEKEPRYRENGSNSSNRLILKINNKV